MSASLVGSEMCIRDSGSAAPQVAVRKHLGPPSVAHREMTVSGRQRKRPCLLYTSDAADDM
eukprot:9419054-Alexandrium_andersonii.AAC.1